MTGNTGGYGTDTAYVAEFYGDHAPTHMNLVAATNGFRPRALDGDFTWCDYGCGNGVKAVKLAAKLFGSEEGDVVIGGKTLKPFEVEKLLSDRLAVIESTLLDKFAELGIVTIES